MTPNTKDFTMFAFILIVIVFALYSCFVSDPVRFREEADYKDICDNKDKVREACQEMVDFIHRPDRIQYFCYILSWIYYHDKGMYEFIQSNPNYIRDHWLVCPGDLCVYEDHGGSSYNRFSRNPDAEAMQRSFRDNHLTHEHVETMPWGKKKYSTQWFVERPDYGNYYRYGHEKDTEVKHSCFYYYFVRLYNLERWSIRSGD
jgi:hypothetical protein